MRAARSSLAGITLALAVAAASPCVGAASGAASGAGISGEFSLVDYHGRAVTEQSYPGKWQLVFFGFTHCPDVCPTTLVTVSSVLAGLGDDAERIQALFISVDPVRDTPQRLREYLAAFGAPIGGLTGTPTQVEAAADGFLARYRKVPQGEDPDDYTIDHSAYLYLMNPRGEFVTAFGFDEPAAYVTGQIRERLAR